MVTEQETTTAPTPRRVVVAELDLDPRELHTRQAAWFVEQAASFEEYMRRVKDPSFVASRGWPIR